jgi:hypothetical protein
MRIQGKGGDLKFEKSSGKTAGDIKSVARRLSKGPFLRKKGLSLIALSRYFAGREIPGDYFLREPYQIRRYGRRNPWLKERSRTESG